MTFGSGSWNVLLNDGRQLSAPKLPTLVWFVEFTGLNNVEIRQGYPEESESSWGCLGVSLSES